jgi:hypothetical protein
MGLAEHRPLSVPSARDLATVIVGADIGQRHDPTAIVVAEEFYVPLPAALVADLSDEEHYSVRFVHRLPLGTGYDQVVCSIAGVIRQLRERDLYRYGRWAEVLGVDERRAEAAGLREAWWDSIIREEQDAWYAWPWRIIVRPDITGVGRPVVDLLRPQLAPYEVVVQPVTITPSEALRTVKGGELSCGKTVYTVMIVSLIVWGIAAQPLRDRRWTLAFSRRGDRPAIEFVPPSKSLRPGHAKRRLRERAEATSRAVFELLEDSEMNDPWRQLVYAPQKPDQTEEERHNEWVRQNEAMSNHFTNVMLRYDRDISTEALWCFDEFQRRGMTGDVRRDWFERPVNTHGLREVAQNLGLWAKRL